MLFWLLSLLSLLCFSSPAIAYLAGGDEATIWIVSIFCYLISIITSGFVFGTWIEHANDLAVVNRQPNIIRFHQDAANNMYDILKDFKFPQPSRLGKNADAPVKIMVKTIQKYRDDITREQECLEQAKIRIERRRRGPMSGVFVVAGDYL